MNDIILIGAGGHAKSCIDVIEQEGKYNIAGLIDSSAELNSKLMGYPIIGKDEDLQELRNNFNTAFISIGQIKTSKVRKNIYDILSELEFILPSIISPNAYVSQKSTINDGTIVMNGAIVNSNVAIGSNCIINSRVLLEHDVTIDNHCHISTGAILNGGVTVKEGSFIGSGSVVRESIAINSKSILSMGSIIKQDIANKD